MKLGNLTVQHIHSYGRDLFYPDCSKSEKLSVLLGVKAFSREKLTELKDLGYEITIKQKEVKL